MSWFEKSSVEEDDVEEEEEAKTTTTTTRRNKDDLNFSTTIPVSKKEIDGTDILRIEEFLDSRRTKPVSNRTELSSKSDDRLYAFSLDSILSEKECERLVSGGRKECLKNL